MKTILVPVDFSTTAINAANYAMRFANQVGASTLVLYNAYEISILSDGGLTLPIVSGTDEIKKASTEKLNQLKQQLLNEYNYVLKVEVLNSFNSVITGIKEAVEEVKADLVIMGITGGSKIEEILIGSNTIDLAKQIEKPVLIIPANVPFKLVRNILYTCDFKNVSDVTNEGAFDKILTATRSQLHLLNIEESETNKSTNASSNVESLAVHTIFGSYEPKYHFVNNKNFVEGVNNFVTENNIDIIIAIPKKRSFIENLFHKSYTNSLAFNTHKPLLLVQ